MLKTKCSPIFPLSYSYMRVEPTAKLSGKQCTHSGLQPSSTDDLFGNCVDYLVFSMRE